MASSCVSSRCCSRHAHPGRQVTRRHLDIRNEPVPHMKDTPSGKSTVMRTGGCGQGQRTQKSTLTESERDQTSSLTKRQTDPQRDPSLSPPHNLLTLSQSGNEQAFHKLPQRSPSSCVLCALLAEADESNQRSGAERQQGQDTRDHGPKPARAGMPGTRRRIPRRKKELLTPP